MNATLEAERDAAIEGVASNAGLVFLEEAYKFVLSYLAQHGATPGEHLTDACLGAGIIPHDTRAFGHVYRRLSKHGQIEKCGSVPRKRGHLTGGGNVWRLSVKEKV